MVEPYLLPVIAIGGLLAIALVAGLSNWRLLREYFAERREFRRFSKFEDGLVADDGVGNIEEFFSGEIKLEQEVTVFIPEPLARDELRLRYQKPICGALSQTGLGKVVRWHVADETCGFDIQLNDFVNGVDLLRRLLWELDTPPGTTIEYSRGELPVYNETQN